MKKNKEALIQEAREMAEDYYRKEKYLCSEAILASVNRVLACGMPEEYVRLTSGFPVGMGGAGCSCGALTGGQTALGLVYGRKEPGGSNRKIMKLGQQLHDRFREKYGSTCCRVLIRDYEFASKEHKERCTKVTGDVCEIVMELILNNQSVFSKIF